MSVKDSDPSNAGDKDDVPKKKCQSEGGEPKEDFEYAREDLMREMDAGLGLAEESDSEKRDLMHEMTGESNASKDDEARRSATT